MPHKDATAQAGTLHRARAWKQFLSSAERPPTNPAHHHKPHGHMPHKAGMLQQGCYTRKMLHQDGCCHSKQGCHAP